MKNFITISAFLLAQAIINTCAAQGSNAAADYTPAIKTAASANFRYAASQATPGVVHIKSYRPFAYEQASFDGQPVQGMTDGSGSGVLLSSNGYIITNYHVVMSTIAVEVVLRDRRSYPALVVGVDSVTDLALLKIEEEHLPYVAMGNSDSLMTGDWVLAIGNPLQVTSTVTAGIISAKSRGIQTGDQKEHITSFIQTDAATNDGSSGGALVDMNGKLVGINTGIISTTGLYSGHSFSIPVEVVKKVYSDLLKYGSTMRGAMGVSLEDMPGRPGAYVESLRMTGAAMQAHIRIKDVIVKINGRNINNVASFYETMQLHGPGESLTVTVLRQGSSIDIPVVLSRPELSKAWAVNWQ